MPGQGRYDRPMRILLLLVSLLVVACGDKETPSNSASDSGGASDRGGRGPGGAAGLSGGGTDAGSEIAALVPGDAHAVLLVESLDKVEEMVAALAAMTRERIPPVSQQFQGLSRIDPSKLDPFQPIAIALKMGGGLMPDMTFVVPAKDAATAQSLANGKADNVSGSYVAVRRGRFGKAGGSRLVRGMPNAPVAFRADLAALYKLNKSSINGALNTGSAALESVARKEFPGVQLGDAINGLVGWTRGTLEQADLLDVALTLDKGWIDFTMTYVAKEGSKIALAPSSASLAGYAAHIPDGCPLALLFSFDVKKFMDLAMQLGAAQMPPSERKAYRAMMKDSEALMDGLGSNWMMAALFQETLRVVGAIEVRDPAAYTTAYMDFLKGNNKNTNSAMGLTYSVEDPRDVKGRRVFGAKINVDSERLGRQMDVRSRDVAVAVPALFGESGPRIDLAPVSDRMLYGIGGGAIEQALGGDGGSASLKDAIKHAGGNLGFLLHIDLRGFLLQMTKLGSKLGERTPSIEEGAPVPISLYGTRHGKRYSVGLHANLAEAIKVFKKVAR